ncbi:MAG: DUF2341 domain-containing protein, partial [Nanoarchaeota archaeon]|nr:DUF2341 domain-containing protein [Nanoarchaeota archaeon]
TDFLADQWYHMVGVKSGTELWIYVDGSLVGGPYTVPATPTLGGDSLYIGDTSYNPINGRVDEVRVTSEIRTADWVNNSYQNIANYNAYIGIGEAEDSSKGVIPMTPDSIPFWTSTSNPHSPSSTACLDEMKKDDTCQTTWTVNATGEIDSVWEFFVTYASTYGYPYIVDNSTSKLNVTIVDMIRPEIDTVQCEEGGSVWKSCSDFVYGEQLTGIRLNCSIQAGYIVNASFSLENLPDYNVFFFNTTIDNSTYPGYWYFDNSNFDVVDSGEFAVNASCISNLDGKISAEINWTVPWGVLNATWLSPAASKEVGKDFFSIYSSRITCLGGECGDITATIDPVMDWWDNDWFYRILVNITETSGGDLDGYQVNLSINTSGPISEGKMDESCSDMRFADDNKNTLGYWIESGCNTANTVVWLNATLSASLSNTVYMYYGNQDSVSASDGDNVFIFFDDFLGSSLDTSKWNVVDATGWSVGAGNLSGTSTTGRIQSQSSYSAPIIQEAKTISPTRAANGEQTAGFWTSDADGIGILEHNGGTPTRYWYRNDAGWPGPYDFDTLVNWHYIRITALDSNNVNLWVEDLTDGSYNSHSATNTISNEPITLGRRYDNGNTGQAYQQYWDWLRLRQYVSSVPTVSYGAEQRGSKGAISMVEGDSPFYTVNQNPRTGATTACLSSMKKDETCDTVWSVNATGELNSTWEFFVMYESSYSEYVNLNATYLINMTIANLTTQIEISSIECQIEGSWESCNNLDYDEELTAVRASCTAPFSDIVSMSYKLENLPDSYEFFDDTTTDNTTGYWLFNNDDIILSDSGGFELTARCTDGETEEVETVSWTVPWGILNSTRILPIGSRQVAQNHTFNYTSEVMCQDGECGNVTATLDPKINWWDDDWNKRKDLNMTNEGSSALLNFPVFLNITYDGDMLANFTDLRFINGTCESDSMLELPYDIESYTSNYSGVWVRIPSLNVGTTNICMYYGNDDATDGQNITGVWSPDYRLVLHLEETSGNHIDSSSYGNNCSATLDGTGTQDTWGRISGTDYFDGTNDGLNCGADTSLDLNDHTYEF